jgi:hypothetical protein
MDHIKYGAGAAFKPFWAKEELSDHELDMEGDWCIGSLTSPKVEPDNYKELKMVLDRAYLQASVGKGKDRHANGLPFHQQPILVETRSVGIGFPAGQARKKVQEATSCYKDHPERAIADLLGAINYIAAEIIFIEEGM